MITTRDFGLETKFQTIDISLDLAGEDRVSGYASLFGVADQSGDVVRRGAYAASLAQGSRRVRMLWQHDPCEPIGVWEEVREDANGLFVRGRLLRDVRRGAEALSLLRAGAIEGLSIGYRTVKAERTGQGRVLQEVDLWEVSLVTFPMLPEARASAKSEDTDLLRALTEVLAEARGGLG